MRIDTQKLTLKQIKDQKLSLIASKKSLPIFSESMLQSTVKGKTPELKTKAFKEESKDPDKIKVKFIGNTALFCDSHMDVLSIGCYTKTVNERGNLIHHLVDHKHELGAKVGKTIEVTTEMISVASFGIDSDVKMTEALMMTSEVNKKWDSKVFQLYKDEAVDQHSVGMQYMKIDLAINSEDEEYKEEFALWRKIFPQIINKEKIEKSGYFWYVTEIKLFEISAVLFGSNELTPTVETQKEVEQPSEDTVQQNENKKPSEDTSEEKSDDHEDQKKEDEEFKRRLQMLNN